MARFSRKNSLFQFQELMRLTYSVPDDRFFSLWDLLANQERFAMRALKGIRKGNRKKIASNLCIAFSWMMTIANRLHVDVEKNTWDRFPMACSYCKAAPCKCKKSKKEVKTKREKSDQEKPKTLSGYQEMFALIYPAGGRNLYEAGIHLAEEIGELSEAVLGFLGEHKNNQFRQVEMEIADYVSCVFGVANSAKIDLSLELENMFCDGCQVCYKSPCECNFSFIRNYKS
ncbi:MAG: hypothetical protein WC831_01375 [Parcubacteria group bacterium]